jgi:hypothetical protein
VEEQHVGLPDQENVMVKELVAVEKNAMEEEQHTGLSAQIMKEQV